MGNMSNRKPISPEEEAMAAKLKSIWDERAKTLGLTQEKAASLMGFESQSSVSQYLLGKMRLNFDAIVKFSRLLGCHPSDINPKLATVFDGIREKIVANAVLANEEQKQIPIVSIEEVAAWINGPRSSERASEGVYMTGLHNLPESAFAMRVQGNSMCPEFSENDEILVNPEIQPDPGMLCVAQAGDKILFRKLRVVGFNAESHEIYELVPTNKDFPTLRSDIVPVTILGKVVESRKRY